MKFIKKSITNKEIISDISNRCGISPLLAELLAIRNITKIEQVNSFLFGTEKDFLSPYIFPQMENVVALIKKFISENKSITIYGDYDCDGVGATSIIYLSLKDIGYTVNYYIPIRAKEGYGLNKEAIRTVKEKFNTDLLITVDCGINSIEEVAFAKSLGMEVIVTDHHQPGDVLPDCLILNPFLTKEATPLCGAGVAFSLISALIDRKTAMKYIDICAISTIADIVPLTGDNRLIVKFGLEQIRKSKCRPGIKELLYFAKVDMKTVSSSDIGYKIAPKINAAGRLDNAELSLKLFIEDDITDLHLIADRLTMLNTERQKMNSVILEEALDKLKNYDFSKYKIIMLKGDWLEGIVGIVCAKLAEYFNLPVILLCYQNDGTVLKGSARSIQGINLFELFDKNNENLLSYGGHEMAAGLSLPNENFDRVLETFNDYIIKHTDNSIFEKKFFYDAELNIEELNPAICSQICLLEPFGHNNKIPVFMDSTGKHSFKQIGKSQHIKAHSKMGDIVAFDNLKYISLFEKNSYTFLYTIEKNYFNGKQNLQFLVKETEFSSFAINEAVLIENFCKTFFKTDTENDNKSMVIKENDFPTLYISYNLNNVKNFIAQHPNVNVTVFNTNRCEISDTLCISPDENYPFYYYAKIVLLENAGQQLLYKFKNAGIPYTIDNKNNRKKPEVSVTELRNLFLSIKQADLKRFKFNSVSDIFNKLKSDNLLQVDSLSKFIIGFYVFKELGLLKIDNNGIININNKKVDVKTSEIYNYFME